MESDNFIFRQIVFREHRHNDARRGNDCHFVGFMRKGSARLVGKDITVAVREGELFYIPMGWKYESIWMGEPDIVFDSYGFTFFPLPSGAACPVQVVPMNKEIQQALNALAEHRIEDCHSIARLYLLLEAMIPVMRTAYARGKESAVEQAVIYMKSHTHVTVPELARECRMSESGLYAAFRATRGCTPIEMWHRVQAERAVNLLISTDLSVEEIVERLEFCSASYFRKILREVTGKTPREIRSSARM